VIKISGRKSNKIKKNLEKKSVNTRIKVVGGVAMLALLIIISRLAYLQFIRGDYYKQKAYSQQTKNESINPSRGTIYDSNGELVNGGNALTTKSIIHTDRRKVPTLYFRHEEDLSVEPTPETLKEYILAYEDTTE
jgi:cell division protein FtsI/penicillin-binding protein 2